MSPAFDCIDCHIESTVSHTWLALCFHDTPSCVGRLWHFGGAVWELPSKKGEADPVDTGRGRIEVARVCNIFAAGARGS